MMKTIGFIGLGTIGGVIARHVQQAGHPMVVYDIRAAACESLIAGGAGVAQSSAEVARNSQIVFTSLPGPPEVEEVALGAGGLLQGVDRGSIYVDLSSSSPD